MKVKEDLLPFKLVIAAESIGKLGMIAPVCDIDEGSERFRWRENVGSFVVLLPNWYHYICY